MRAMCGDGATWRRRQDEVRATRDEGEGDQKEGNGQHLKRNRKKGAPGGCSVAPRVYERKGAAL